MGGPARPAREVSRGPPRAALRTKVGAHELDTAVGCGWQYLHPDLPAGVQPDPDDVDPRSERSLGQSDVPLPSFNSASRLAFQDLPFTPARTPGGFDTVSRLRARRDAIASFQSSL